MSNLLKRGTTVSKSERVIDSNTIIRNKITSLLQQENGKIDPDGFVNGLKADIVESLVTDPEEMNGGDPEQQDQAGQQEAGNFTAAAMEEANNQAEQIRVDASQEAERIISEANTRAEEIQNAAQEQGYQQGLSQAEQELQMKSAALDKRYEDKQNELEQEYQQKRKQMEPELVHTLLDVFEKVTKTVAEDNKEIILHLINSVMTKCELSKNFVIKVSPDDYKFVAANQGKIFCAMNTEVQIDVVEDAAMKMNECLIETDAGIFNCSLDIELNNLIREIKLLSCL